ncbi:hypothetical protein B0T13DRAFT_122438 [Neurospora crassa]|nr:hypothetical protein B0T13DRAFT_122438 [Neurospora crassa]
MGTTQLVPMLLEMSRRSLLCWFPLAARLATGLVSGQTSRIQQVRYTRGRGDTPTITPLAMCTPSCLVGQSSPPHGTCVAKSLAQREEKVPTCKACCHRLWKLALTQTARCLLTAKSLVDLLSPNWLLCQVSLLCLCCSRVTTDIRNGIFYVGCHFVGREGLCKTGRTIE